MMKANRTLQSAVAHMRPRYLLIVTLLAVTMLRSLPVTGQPVNPNDPASVVAFLTSSSRTHGLVERYLDEETRSLLAKVVENPTAYVQALSDGLRVPPPRETGDWDSEGRRLANTLYIVKRIGPANGRSMVEAFFEDVRKKLASEQRVQLRDSERDQSQKAASRALLFLRDQALDVLADFNDPHAVDECVKSVEQERTQMTEVTMLNYLEKVSPLRPDVRPKLEEMYDSPTSPLRNHPQLKRVLDAMDTAEREKHPDKKDAESRPESERNP